MKSTFIGLWVVIMFSIGIAMAGCAKSDKQAEQNISKPSQNSATSVPSDTNSLPDKSADNSTKSTGKSPDTIEPPKNSAIKIDLPDKPGEMGWTKPEPKPNFAKNLVTQLDTNIKAFRNGRILAQLALKRPEGQGLTTCTSVVRDASAYKLEFSQFVQKPLPHDETFTSVSMNGKVGTLVVEPGGDEGKYVPGRREPSAQILRDFPDQVAHYLIDGYASERTPFTALYDAAAKAGWKQTLETKKFEAGDYYRLLLVSNSAPVRVYEITIHKNSGLPAKINCSIADKKPTQVVATISWDVKDTITDAELTPYKSAPRIKEVIIPSKKIPVGT